MARLVLGLPPHPLAPPPPPRTEALARWAADYWTTLGTSGLFTALSALLLVGLVRHMGCSPGAARPGGPGLRAGHTGLRLCDAGLRPSAFRVCLWARSPCSGAGPTGTRPCDGDGRFPGCLCSPGRASGWTGLGDPRVLASRPVSQQGGEKAWRSFISPSARPCRHWHCSPTIPVHSAHPGTWATPITPRRVRQGPQPPAPAWPDPARPEQNRPPALGRTSRAFLLRSHPAPRDARMAPSFRAQKR